MSPKPIGRKPTPKMTLVAARLQQARTYILQNPTHSKSQCVLATGCSDATVARARRDLILEGLLAPPRNAPVAKAVSVPEPKATQPTEPTGSVDPPPAVSPAPAPVKGASGLLDHAAMIALAEMVDAAVESGDDEAIHKKLIKQCLTFAFRPDLHPDTRMTASQMYGKLRDMARLKELGPGKPKTFVIGTDRLADMLMACGPEMTMAAVAKAFTVKEGNDGQAKNDEAASAGGTAQAPGEAGHASGPAPSEVVRPIDVELRRHGDAKEGVEHSNPTGPSEGREDSTGDPRTPSHPHGDSPWN
jgi:hypothetical protein